MEDLITSAILSKVREAVADLALLPFGQQVECSNAIKSMLHAAGPFAEEPVDCVRWVTAETVKANDYNPNTVAPPEMRLLEVSILADGYTQPVVANAENDAFIVVDGFHRSRIGKESKEVRKRVRGYLPVVQIREQQSPIEARMASTIRHNRARGKHGVEPMTGIVTYLAKNNWGDEKIARELGMDADEVLRHKQITGLAELFADRDFSNAWEA